MSAADGRAHTTDGEHRCRAWRGDGDKWLCLGCGADADAKNAAERRRAAEDGQRLRERVEALAAEWEAGRRGTGDWLGRYDVVASLRAALRDDTGNGR